MNLSPNQTLSFSWPVKENVFNYKVVVYINDYAITSFITSSNEYIVKDLYEGDEVYLDIFAHRNGLTAATSYHTTNTKKVAIYNFREDGQYLSINSLLVNESLIFQDSNTLTENLSYSYQEPVLNFFTKLKNPRNNSIIINPEDEPFFKNITYEFKEGDNVLTSGVSESFEIVFKNIFQAQNVTANFVVNDEYGESDSLSINLSLIKPKVSQVIIKNPSVNEFEYSFDVDANYNIIPSYSIYQVNSVGSTDDVLFSGIAQGEDIMNITMPTSVSGQLQITPYNWAGPGSVFTRQDLFYQ